MAGESISQSRGAWRKLKASLVRRGLDHLRTEAMTRPVGLDFAAGGDKLVCVSDLHRGKRDGADDFRRSERVYNAALAWYLETGYRLAILGDAEELWECKPKHVLGSMDAADELGYARSLWLERCFRDQPGRYLRVYGNHDRLWKSRRKRRALEQHVGKGLEIPGAWLIRVAGARGSEIMLTHGDAGTLDSAVLAPVSKHFVRFWAWWQKRIGASTGVPADNWELRVEQDAVMYEWAESQGVLLIAGHTHRPVFATQRASAGVRAQAVRDALARLEHERDGLDAEAVAAREFEIAELRRQVGLRACVPQMRPCYFNTGACCFGDGDITAIEISDGQIRLVRWAWHPDDHEVVAHTNAHASLHTVLEAIRHPGAFDQEEQQPEAVHVKVRHDEVGEPAVVA